MRKQLEDDDIHRRKITELDWRRYGLPTFLGVKLSTPDGKGMVVPVSDWVRVSGGMFRKVDVVDDLGKVLFTVPALGRRLHCEDGDIPLISAIRHYTDLRGAGRVNQSERFLENKILSTITIDDESERDNLKTWNDIFLRYPESTPYAFDLDCLFAGGGVRPYTDRHLPYPNSPEAAEAKEKAESGNDSVEGNDDDLLGLDDCEFD